MHDPKWSAAEKKLARRVFEAALAAELAEIMAEPNLVDLRNVYRRKEVEAAGLAYSSIGRPTDFWVPPGELEAAE